VIWFRVIVLFLRPTVYAFAMMLAAVLAGIAAGSYAVTPLMKRRVNWLLALALIELALASVVLVSFSAALGRMPDVVAWSVPTLSRVMPEYLAPLVAVSLVSIFPAMFLTGMAFPIGLRLWAGTGRDAAGSAAARIGVFYSSNVCGSIAGALVAGFVLLPWLGSRVSLVAVSAIVLLSGVLLLLALPRNGRGWPMAAAAALAVAFLGATILVPDPSATLLAQHSDSERILWREEGVQATVSVHELTDGHRVMNLDGLHQASDFTGMVYIHRRIGHLAMALHPEPRRAVVIGLGGGATAGAVSQHPGVDLDVVELSRSVVRGAEYFSHINYGLLHLPHVTLRVDDGRNYLMLTPKRYDVVTADIIQPYHAGAGNVYSAEYFALVREALDEDGVFLQWVPGTEAEYKLIVRTFLSVFPNTTMWADGSLMAGTKRPMQLRRSDFEWRLQVPGISGILKEIGLGSFDDLLRHYVAGPEELRRFVGEGPVLTDNRPVTEYFLRIDRTREVDLSGLKGDPERIVIRD
jgi:spermidine synthase